MGEETLEAALRSYGDFDPDNPFPLFAALRAKAPVHPVTLADGHSAWLVTRYEEARQALNDHRLSKNMQAAMTRSAKTVAPGLPGPDFARHMLAVDPPDHSRLRRLAATAFSPRRIDRLQPRVADIVDDLLDGVSAPGPDATVDLVANFAFPLPFTVICELLGVGLADRGDLGTWFTTLLAPTSSAEPPPAAVAASNRIVAYLGELVAAKRAEPADDLISGLIEASDGESRLDTKELLSTIFQLIVAGHDTTASLIGNGTVALLTHPDQLAALRADEFRLTAAIEEFLRFDAPVPHSTFRYTTEAVVIGGVEIPAYEQVLISLVSADRDPARYADPDALDITRNDRSHLAFGHGIHFCLGAPLARMEARIAFGSLLRRFPQLRLAVPPEELHWSHGDGLVLRGLSSLPVVLGPDSGRG